MTRRTRYRAGAGFVLRTPLLPYPAAAADPGELVARPEVAEAIFLASPALHGELAAWRADPASPRGRRVERALGRYATRMATRATPFGLFAGVAAGRIAAPGEAERLEIEPAARHRRRTRVDNAVLAAVAAGLAATPEARRALTFRPNSSLVRAAGRLRYAEARGADHHLVAVEATPPLLATLERARGGARLDALAAALVAGDPELTREDAERYVAELADAQILLPDLEVPVTGPEPIDAIIAGLEAAGLEAAAAALAAVRARLAALDAAGLGVAPARYRPIAEAIAALPGAPPLDPARLFQVDVAIAPAAPLALGADVVTRVQRAVEVLQRIALRPERAALAAFRRGFVARWEDREVPLGEALDEEAGIGFGAATGPGSEGSPLLAGLPFPAAGGPPEVPWGRREAWLLARLMRATAAGEPAIDLDDDDLDALAPADPARPPDALGATIRLGRREGEPEIVLESVYGPSGARTLGRFCHLDGEIEALVREHLDAEARLRPGVVLAEIVHLGEARAGNILCRPVLREHELIYLGRGGAPAARQLGITDLMVSVRGDRVVLRSRSLDREVIPRLTSAHDVQGHGLGVYRFLHALQAQDGAGAGWSWGPLGDAPWLPRVRWRGVVLHRARWRLDRRELATLPAGADAVAALRRQRGLPRHVAIADGDHEQLVDLDQPHGVAAFAEALAGRDQARLVEVFPAPDAAVVRGPGGRHACEVVLAFVRDGEPAAAPRAPAPTAACERRFAPGSRWLYARLETGVASADRVLREVVAPLVRAARASGAARRWFFVRYADPAPHLRLRLDGDPARLAAEVLPALHRLAAPLLDDGTLIRIGLDTYQREVERYGGPAGVELVEELFWHDSEAALAIVEGLDDTTGADARWQLALCSADGLLGALGLAPEARAEVHRRARNALAAEHRATAALRTAIGARYRAYRDRIDALLAGEGPDELAPGLAALAARDRAIGAVAAALAPSLVDMAWSLVHMSCNRLLHASARAHELVLHDLLWRHHARRRALEDAA